MGLLSCAPSGLWLINVWAQQKELLSTKQPIRLLESEPITKNPEAERMQV